MTRPYIIGLTGSIGMGKSTTLSFFAEAGVPVWDADAAVHRFYTAGGAAVAPLGALFPQAVSDGAIDRSALKALIAADSSALRRIEAAVHPLVAADRAAFIAAHLDTPLIVLDVPLLFETGAEAQVDGILVVSAPAHVQRERVLARPGMTEDHLAAILARQMPDSEKRRRATWVIETTGLDEPRAAVRKIIDTIRDCHA